MDRIAYFVFAAFAVAAAGHVWSETPITRGTFHSKSLPRCVDWHLPADRTGGLIHGSQMDDFFSSQWATSERVKDCLGEGVDPNLRGPDGGSTLESAARWSKDPAVVDALLDGGATIDAAAVRSASTRQDTEVLALMLERGVDATAVSEALAVAASRRGAVGREAVRLLLDSGADVNWRSRTGETPLFDAAERGGAKMVALLLEAGATPSATNDAGENALHRAAGQNDDPIIVELLVHAGTHVDALGRDGETPLLIALRSRRGAVAAALLEAGADPNARDGLGRTPLHMAAARCGPALVRTLVERGAAVDAATKDGATALHFARRHANTSVVAILLGEGAPADAKDRQGRTAADLEVDARPEDELVKGRRFAGSYNTEKLSVSGDFDADGLPDEAFLQRAHCRYALAVRFGQGAQVSVHTLDSVEDTALSLVPQGQHVGECQDAPKTTNLATDGIRLTKREGEDLLFRWRDGRIERRKCAHMGRSPAAAEGDVVQR